MIDSMNHIIGQEYKFDFVPVMEFTLERAVQVAEDHVMGTYY